MDNKHGVIENIAVILITGFAVCSVQEKTKMLMVGICVCVHLTLHICMHAYVLEC